MEKYKRSKVVDRFNIPNRFNFCLTRYNTPIQNTYPNQVVYVIHIMINNCLRELNT